MFEMLPNVWTPVLPLAEITDDPVVIDLAGENLVLFRNLEGKIGALLDRCPHRGAALSLGRVNDGCLECPYHGWQFAHNGACTKVPLNNPHDIDLSQLSAVSLPTRIIAGLVWVFTGQGKAPELQIPESLTHPENSYMIHHEVWNAHWTRIIENAMDYVHLPFVHRNSFGGVIGKPALEAGSVIEFQIEQTESSVQVFNCYNNISSGFTFEWHQPNLVTLKFDEIGLPARVHLFGVPMNEHQTRYLLAILMLNGTDAPSEKPIGSTKQRTGSQQKVRTIADEFIKPIVEDRLVIESQTGEIPTTTEECNVPTDKATLLFRRWYHQSHLNTAAKSIH